VEIGQLIEAVDELCNQEKYQLKLSSEIVVAPWTATGSPKK
jgi:hypothetical protein